MDRQIINFSANEQSLIKTGGTDHYAGNVVRYIEAHFDLGENWTGYDSVRAIWRNKRDVTRYSTVLNSEGVCVVPFEVLTLRGDVCMNLVGSIVENDVLVDRLTTYPICALTIDVPAMVDGSDPASITPSEYEQFVASVRNDADRAEAGAESAEASADRAELQVEYVIASAQSAEASALRASASAQTAQTSERNASEYAQNAHISAQNAETFALDAEEAKRKILSMRAEATTLAEGSQATASYSDGVLTLGIPRGDTGATGAKGDKGDTGATPNLTIGTVETLEPTESATATITGTAENPVLNLGLPQGRTGEVTYEDLESLLPRDTATGNPITITDGQSVIPVKSLEVELEPIQDLHGYDKPWAGGSGVNKLPPATTKTTTEHGITAVVDEAGRFAFSGTASGGSFNHTFVLEKPYTIQSGDYLHLLNDVANGSAVIILQKANNAQITAPTLSPINRIFDLSSYAGETVESIRFYIGNNVTYNATVKPMICQTSTATTWTPYENIAPISGHTEVNTHRTGKNLFDLSSSEGFKSQYTGLTCTKTSRGFRVSTSVSQRSADLDFGVLPSGTYTISFDISNPSGITTYMYLSKNGVAQSIAGTSSITFTADGDSSYGLMFYAKNSVTYYDVVDIQLEFGSTATSYEPYIAPTTYTTDLGQTVYGGTLDVVSGELVVDRAIFIADGLERVRSVNYHSSTGLYYTIVNLTNVSGRSDNPPLISDRFASGALVVGECYMTSLGQLIVAVLPDQTISTWEEATQWFADNPTHFVYELAEPQTIQLDPTTIMLLTGDNNLWSDGQLTMVYSADVTKWIEKQLS